jgi:hypothetical protein
MISSEYPVRIAGCSESLKLGCFKHFISSTEYTNETASPKDADIAMMNGKDRHHIN